MLRFPDDTQTRVNGLDEGGGGEHYWGEWGRQEHDIEGIVGVSGIDLRGDKVYGEEDRWEGDDGDSEAWDQPCS